MDTATPPETAPTGRQHPGLDPADHLSRRRHGRMLAGVAGGLADWFGVDATVVRVAFAALAVLGGMAVPVYVAFWLLIPEEGSDTSVAEELLARQQAR